MNQNPNVRVNLTFFSNPGNVKCIDQEGENNENIIKNYQCWCVVISDLPFSSVELSQTYCFSAGLISPSGQVVAVVCWESAGAVC